MNVDKIRGKPEIDGTSSSDLSTEKTNQTHADQTSEPADDKAIEVLAKKVSETKSLSEPEKIDETERIDETEKTIKSPLIKHVDKMFEPLEHAEKTLLPDILNKLAENDR